MLPFLVAVALWMVPTAQAHPLPGTVISITLDDARTRFDIEVPIPELRLALPASVPGTADLSAEPHRSAVAAYFLEHCIVRSTDGVAQPLAVEEMSVSERRDDTVGLYQILRIRVAADPTLTFTGREFTLGYDAVIHRVPNHFAVVQVVQDFRAGALGAEPAGDWGVVRYDFSNNRIPPLEISVAPGSVWRGVLATVGLGFRHVIVGIDHLAFLLTLLFVAPLRAVDGRWSLFQGWSYAARRFLAISLAFTLGHSAALLIGAGGLVPMPRQAIEMAVAATVLVTAIHAIRPLFATREWMIAAAFGTIHGLAFSEALAGLAVSGGVRALAIFGFNAGVEGAQLVAMLCAVPVLAASRLHSFDVVRVVAMTGTAAAAVFWLIERGAF
ncbi:MAG: HupE/UreJ family protein [Vicinamibacterales bacterium]